MMTSKRDRFTKTIITVRDSWIFRFIEMTAMLMSLQELSIKFEHSLMMQLAFGYFYLTGNGIFQAILASSTPVDVFIKFNNKEFFISSFIVYFTEFSSLAIVRRIQPYLVFTCSIFDTFCRFEMLTTKTVAEEAEHIISRLGSEFAVFFFSNRRKGIKISRVCRPLFLSVIANHVSYQFGQIIVVVVELLSSILKLKYGFSLYEEAATQLLTAIDLLRRFVSK